ncbi:MAG: ATP-binding protein [Pseudomonadota bacterium]|nr:ATP-binding protein [Pseudomonadota bacterium]
MAPVTAHSAAHQNLRTLCLIRLIPFGGQTLAALYLALAGGWQLPWPPLAALLAAFAALIALSWRRAQNPRPIADGEFFAQLVADALILTLLLYLSGGATNPFVSYYLVPITIAAITLPRGLTLAIGLLCVAAYGGLLFWHVAVPALAPPASGHGGHGDAGLNSHVLGMWVNFAVSALLIIVFVTRMAAAVKARDQALLRQGAEARARQLEDEQLLAVATLAASAAHDLGTPLNTIRLIADDWRSPPPDGDVAACREDMALISTQVTRCQDSLRKLSATARAFSRQESEEQDAHSYFTELVDRWLLMRPDVNARCEIADGEAVAVNFHPSLAASIHNILNNAADASPDHVAITVRWDRERATVAIRDRGPGIDPARADGGNGPQASDKRDGLGLGLFLSRSILARHGASIDLSPHPEGGTLAVIQLPLAASRHPSDEPLP